MRRFSGHRSFSPPLRSVVLSRCPEKKYSDQLFSFYFLGLTSLTNAQIKIFTILLKEKIQIKTFQSPNQK